MTVVGVGVRVIWFVVVGDGILFVIDYGGIVFGFAYCTLAQP